MNHLIERLHRNIDNFGNTDTDEISAQAYAEITLTTSNVNVMQNQLQTASNFAEGINLYFNVCKCKTLHTARIDRSVRVQNSTFTIDHALECFCAQGQVQLRYFV